jgi:hypothetical protein
MMRRGPLADYPIDGVLRTAAAERVSGSITTEGATVDGTIYLSGGHLCGAEIHGTAPSPDLHGDQPDPKRVARHLEVVLAVLTEARGGWYRHDPIGTAHIHTRWQFTVDEVLTAAEQRRRSSMPIRRWALRPVRVQAPSDLGTTLDRDAWHVIATLASPAVLHRIHDELGWPPERLAEALSELERAGVLATGHDTAPAPAPAPAAAAATGAARHASGWDGTVSTTTRPLAAVSRLGADLAPAVAGGRPAAVEEPSDPPASRRTALKRLIDSLRS